MTTSCVPGPRESPQEPVRKLSEMLLQGIEPLSPLQVDFPDSKFNLSKDLNNTEEPMLHVQPTTTDISSSESPSVPKRKKGNKLSGGTQYEEQERGSWINIKLVKGKNTRNSCDSGLTDTTRQNSQESVGGKAELKPEEKTVMGGSLDRVSPFYVLPILETLYQLSLSCDDLYHFSYLTD